ncbi:hypothetical protein VNO78_34984 [Psophocarpus tetragonolobus]|uniref:Nitrate regulatory gene2 protein n=1 Tax=Psophocarpus tetragonolobus TaxID=3891 RepID=A0AAN9RH43_PSOTE
MGCWYSRIEREETVSHYKARKRCMKQLKKARRAFSSAHATYIHSLHNIASALLLFANAEETTLLLHYLLPPTSPTSDTLLSSSSSAFDFWNPFHVSLSSTVESNNFDKDFVQAVKVLHNYFLKAAHAAIYVSLLLEVPSSTFRTRTKASKVYSCGWSLSSSLWSWCSISKLSKRKSGPVTIYGAIRGVNGSHSSTVERLYKLEKKLCQEVKNAETIKMEHEKKVARLRKLEMKKGDYVKIKRNKEVKKLESLMTIASHAIETTDAEIIKLRETELYPQLVKLVKGLRSMWRSMYKYHEVQKNTVQQLEGFNNMTSSNPTSDTLRKSTLHLEVGIQQWHQSFCKLFKAHRDYIQSLTAWLSLSLFHFSRNPVKKTADEPKIHTLCEEWNLAVDRIPEKVTSEGIKSLLEAVHANVVQQREEHKQKKKLVAALKKHEKKVVQLQSIESKHDPYSMLESSDTKGTKACVKKKRLKVEHLRAKVEKVKIKHENSIKATRAMTRKNLQMGFLQVFQGIMSFSSVSVEVFESIYNKANTAPEKRDV